MKSIFRKTFQLLTPGEKKRFYLLVMLNSLVCAIDILSLALLVLVVGFYTQHSSKYLLFLPDQLLDPKSVWLVLLFFIFFVAKSTAGFLAFHLQFRYVYNVATRMAADNMLYYFEDDYANYVNVPLGTHIRHISDHTIQFGHYVLFGIYQIITEYILISLTTICILLFNAKTFLFLLILLLPPVIIAGYFTKHRLRNARAHVKQTSESSLQYLQEALQGYIEANIYHKAGFFLNRFIAQQKQFNMYLSEVHISQGLPVRMVEAFAVLGLLILISINNVWGNGDTTTEIINIGAFMAVAYKAIPGIVRISNLSAQLKTYEFIVDDMARTSIKIKTENNAEKRFIEHIRFDNVIYSYGQHSHSIKLNIDIPRGTFAGVSGNSGKGKTTFINMLLGFVAPVQGNIEINAQQTDLHELQAYRSDISYVKQQTYLFQDTILKNITLSEEAVYDERLAHILQITGLDHLVAQFKNGIDTVISDNGKNISGGQRQRIAIARALYKDANVIILDEAFNELDAVSEQSFLQYFQAQAKQGKIVILITHNKESLSYCDQCIDM